MLTDMLDIELIEKVISTADNIEGLDRSALKVMMIRNLCTTKKFIMVDIDNDKVTSFMFATIESLDGQDVCFIQACASSKEGMVQVILDNLIKWSKNAGLKKVVFMTKRNPLAWERKYKFNKSYSVMERSI